MSRNTLRVGTARLVMTATMPFCSTTKTRFVSPGGVKVITGSAKIRFPNAFVVAYPFTGGMEGIRRVVLPTRLLNPYGCALIDTAANIRRPRGKQRGYFMLKTMANRPAHVKG